jgi:spore germination protein YaaH
MKSLIGLRLILVSISILLFSSCSTKTASYGPDIYKPDTGFKVVGYLSTESIGMMDELELDKLTYLNLAFGNPDKEGNMLVSGNADIAAAVKKGHEARLKVFISLAGGGRPDTAIWKSLLLPENRSSFISKLVSFVEANNLDGIDVDIEGNLLPTIGESYNPFVIELRKALHAKGKGITTALGATGSHKAISQEALEAYDFINVMVYDKTGIWRPNQIGPHSPYSYAEEAIRFWTVEKKIPAERIILGVPFYGFDFTPPARYISFKEIIDIDASNGYRDSIDMKYYNGIPTIVKKTELAKSNLGGVMIWEIAYDVKGEMSLLRALDQTIKAGSAPVTTFYKDEDGDGFGNQTKPFQAGVAPQGYVSNRDDTDDTNAKIHP